MTTEAQARAHLAAAAARVSRSGTAAAAVAARVVADLESPLRIGVVGRVSAGKSTLVNALLEEDIAPTGAGETTRVPTWFLPSDRWDFAEVVTGDGRRVPLGLEGGRIPLDLPAGVEVSGSAIEVYRQAEVLRSAVIVDTPGTASALSRAGSAGALAAHDSTHRDAARVDALVVVLSRDVGPEDLEVTRALVGTSSSRGLLPVVGVLTKVDMLGGDLAAANAAAQERAAALHEAAPDLFATIVPVTGLLAMSVTCGRITERLVRASRGLAEELPPPVRAGALADARLLEHWPLETPREVRAELLGTLTLAGLATTLQLVEDDPTLDAVGLNGALDELSGRAQLVASLTGALVHRADLLKSIAAMDRLRPLVHELRLPPDVADVLYDDLDAPELEPIRIARGLHKVDLTTTVLPRDLHEQVHLARAGRLGEWRAEGVAGADPSGGADRSGGTGLGDVAATAEEQIGRWRRWERFADGPGATVARAMCAAWELTLTATPAASTAPAGVWATDVWSTGAGGV
ncbi:dynamin family protein [Salana multivorans]